MRTLIFGAGAIGQWLGALLHSSGTPVELFGRPGVAAKLAETGGVILNDSPPISLPFLSDSQEIRGRRFDTVICTVKTYAVEGALRDLQQNDVLFERLVCFQNGWGSEEHYRSIFPSIPLWSATTTRAVGVETGGRLLPSNKGGLAVAPWGSEVDIPECFKKVKIPLIKVERGLDLKWSKLLLNLIGNATGAVTGLAPNQLAQNPLLMRTELLLAREALLVGRALGAKRVNLPGFPVAVLSEALEKLPLKLVAPLIASRLRGARGDKLPSLFFDLEDPTRPTELDQLNGAVVHEGEKLGVSTPKQRALVELFHRCRTHPDVWSAIRSQPNRMLEYV